MSFWCAIGLHDWEGLRDEDSEREYDLRFPCSGGSNRICLRDGCGHKDLRATRWLKNRDDRIERMKEVSKDGP